MYFFSNFEPVHCYMSSSVASWPAYRFLQEADQVVWYSISKNFPVCCDPHSIRLWYSQWRRDVFLKFSCFFYDPMDVDNLISSSSAFSKSSLYMWKFSVNVLLKPSLKDLDHYLAGMWNECSCAAPCMPPRIGPLTLWQVEASSLPPQAVTKQPAPVLAPGLVSEAGAPTHARWWMSQAGECWVVAPTVSAGLSLLHSVQAGYRALLWGPEAPHLSRQIPAPVRQKHHVSQRPPGGPAFVPIPFFYCFSPLILLSYMIFLLSPTILIWS